MNKILYTLILFSIIFCNSYDILSELNKKSLNWSLIEQIGEQRIYEFYNADCDCIYTKVEKPVDYKENKILNIINKNK